MPWSTQGIVIDSHYRKRLYIILHLHTQYDDLPFSTMSHLPPASCMVSGPNFQASRLCRGQDHDTVHIFCSNMWHPAICPSVTKPVNREHNLQMEVPMEKNMNAGMFHCHVWLPAGRWVIGYWKLSAFLCMKIAILESTPLAKAQSGMPMRAQNRRSFVVCNHHQPSIFVANNVWDCYIHIYIHTHIDWSF